jgi:hypothetical protein
MTITSAKQKASKSVLPALFQCIVLIIPPVEPFAITKQKYLLRRHKNESVDPKRIDLPA